MAQSSEPRVAEPDAASASEAMTASSGADPPDKEAGLDGATPYGTRSRNRGGNARPNYAEDKDIEMDVYDYYHSDKKDADGIKKSSRQASLNGSGEATRVSAASRRSGAEDGRAASTQNGHRDHNAVGSASAQPATQPSSASQPSRKRKAAASATASTRRQSGALHHQAGTPWPETNMLTFDNCDSRPVNGQMVADDGTVLEANDHVYLVCEPPGEPYYLGRIMEFLHQKNDNTRPVDALRINWFYRPKDIGRKVTDTRLVFASMHSDISPLTALRGKCQIRHRVEIGSLDDFRKTPDSFWYEKLYDRYIQKNYDIIPTSAIVNVPENVKKVLDDRWKYVLVEQGRGKELTSAVKLCKRCSGYCASNDSVDCAVCHFTYHMNCVKPPLLKKPSRGFAWSCAACSRAQERKLENRHTADVNGDGEDDEALDDDDDDPQGIETDRTSPADDGNHHEGTAEQVYQASLWPYRYLGLHCKPEDALDYDDRIYPRTSNRIGPRHQAVVGAWPGRPVEYVKPLEVRKGRGQPKLSKEAHAAHVAEKARRGNRPKWVQDQPAGYVARGEDLDENDPNATATLLWKPPSDDSLTTQDLDSYKNAALKLTKKLNVPELSTNLQDAAVELLYRHDYDSSDALSALSKIDRKILGEPNLSATELKKFEEGISKFGSELHLVMKHVKTLTPGEVVRFYYTWKKSERGQHVWSHAPGRRGKKQAMRADAVANKVTDDVADNEDDSAFDTEKAAEKKRGFVCQFCSTTSSRQWRRAPNATTGLVDETGAETNNKDKNGQYVVALCRRCAELWRRYAVRWEDVEEVAKKVAQTGGKAWKRRQDEELLKELQVAQDLGLTTPERAATPMAGPAINNGQEPPRKKLKGAPDRDSEGLSADTGAVTSKKKDKTGESTPAPTPLPDMPKPRTLPCAVCGELEPLGDQHLSCRECRLTIHRNCYGVMDSRIQGKWLCDMCANDKSPQVSIQYKCVLCPVELTEQEVVEQPKLTHHKKKMSEKDRERERIEVQQARKAAEQYRKRQEELNRPINPREPLKRTADNNWVHVSCAIWTPEVKFGNAKALEPSEGIPSIPRTKYDEVCQACNQQGGTCILCHQCRIPFHVECARQHGHVLGFDVTPVKSSRRDQFNIVTLNGESGTMSAAMWCKDHVPTKTMVHKMHDMVEDTGLNALQFFVQNFKQADLTLTGTVRKANLMTAVAKLSGTAASQPALRRASTTTTSNTVSTYIRNGDATDAATNARQPGEKVCITCGIDVSPRWWSIDNSHERHLTNGHYGAIGSEAQKFVEQRKFQCHKCRKLDRTPKPHVIGPGPAPEPPRGYPSEPPIAPPPLRSPPPPVQEYRDGRQPSHAWPQHHPTSHPTGPPPVQAPSHQGHGLGATRPPASLHHTYAPPPPPPPPHQAPRTPGYGDWAPHQHSSAPRSLNGGPPPPPPPPPLSGGPPMSSLSALRPPAMSGPQPGPPIPVTGHQRAHGSPPYVNGLPPSPRRHNGPGSPSPYPAPYHGAPNHPPPPAPVPLGHGPPHAVSHGSPRGMSNGRPPPPPPPPRTDPYASHGAYSHRPGYPGPNGTPPLSRNALPQGPDSQPSSGPPPRGPESRPASGASASPSLRNLLS